MIDVIIPVYNSGKNIGKTLNSLLSQVNYKDLCIYIIDDCSSEDYTDILNHYKKYLNITYHKLDKNSGPGIARNYGLEHSNNEYVVFLDSDDEFYKNDSISTLLKNIENYDMVLGKIQQMINDNYIVRFHEGCLHGKMYRRSFLEKNNIKFPAIRTHEDNVFNRLCLAFTNNINMIDDIIYRYNDTENSITNTESRIISFKCYILAMNYLFDEIKKHDEVNLERVGETIFSVMMSLYHNYLLHKDEYEFCFKELSYLKNMYNEYNTCIDDSRKLRIFKNFNYPVKPDMTFYEFINKIEDK